MIQDFSIKNLANIQLLNISKLEKINVFIGENDTGKTMVLKILYSLCKSIESLEKGSENKTLKEIISEKIYWTFQVDKIGDLVTKDRENKSEHFELQAKIDDQNLVVSFSDSAVKQVGTVTDRVVNREENSIFIPAKEVLSLFGVIKSSREIDKVFGFDDTYLDLVKALEKEPQKGANFQNFAKSKKILDRIIGGKIYYENGIWFFRKNKMKIPIYSTAEGIKKIGIVDRLLSNRYIRPNSVIFIDEPESFLHPKAIIEFLDIITLLAKNDIQIFIATHSYFVINKLMLVAKKENMNIPIVSLYKDKETEISNLKYGLPDNPIVDTSITLYEEELDLDI
jgi:AAA15 family ATPase/GTPase